MTPSRTRSLGPALLALLAASLVFADITRIDSLNTLGREYVFSNIDESIELYSDLAEEAETLDYDEGRARALMHLSVALYLRGRYDESVDVHLRATRLLEDLDMDRDLALAYGDFGYQMKRRDLPRAMEYMRRGIAIAERVDFLDGLCALYDNYGVMHYLAGDPDSAAHYYRRALALKISLDDAVGIPYSLNNLSGIHMERGEFAAAESLLVRSDAYRNAPDADAYGRLVNSVQWGDLNAQRGDLAEAARYYRRSLAMPGADEQGYLVSYCLDQLTALAEARGDWQEAFRYLHLSVAHRDSMVNVETNERIAALEIEFETEKKDRRIAESQLAIEERNRQVTVLVALAVVLAALAAGLTRYQQLKRKQLQRDHEWRSRLRRAEYDQRMADEKLRIARELHDNVGAQLTFLISSLDNLSRGAGADDLPRRLADVGEFGRTTLDDLRQTVWAMRHEDEGLEALVHKLNELKRQCAASDHAVELEIARDEAAESSVSSTRMLAMFRIVQEAVQNAVKHADAERIVVRLETSAAGVSVSVTDDGTGFDPDATSRRSGLANMADRCRETGGEFDLRSGGDGTCISCRFPPESGI